MSSTSPTKAKGGQLSRSCPLGEQMIWWVTSSMSFPVATKRATTELRGASLYSNLHAHANLNEINTGKTQTGVSRNDAHTRRWLRKTVVASAKERCTTSRPASCRALPKSLWVRAALPSCSCLPLSKVGFRLAWAGLWWVGLGWIWLLRVGLWQSQTRSLTCSTCVRQDRNKPASGRLVPPDSLFFFRKPI